MWSAKTKANLKQKFLSLFPKKRRKQIEDWDFIMAFQSQFKSQIEIAFSNIQCKQKMQYKCIDHESAKETYFLIKLSNQVTIDQAHNLKILKLKDKGSFKLGLMNIDKLMHADQIDVNSNYFNYLAFLKARYAPENAEVYQQQKYSAFNKYKIKKYEIHKQRRFFSQTDKEEDKAQLFTPEEELRAKYNFLLTYSQTIQSKSSIGDVNFEPFIQLANHSGFKQLVPIHKSSRYRPIVLQSIRQYAGANGQTYFAFVAFMQKWLIFPTIIGLLTVGVNNYFDYTADDSPVDFFYALFIMLWSILFITKWEKDQQWQTVKQQSGYNDLWSQHQNIIARKDLKLRDSLITGKKQYFLPFKEKIFYYGISFFVCFFILFVSLVWMVFSLNARGFVKQHHKLLFSESVSKWAEQGGMFDSNTYWGLIPTIVHGLVINIFDQMVYRPLAKKMTKFQRHRMSKSYENSIILKFFIYQFIVTFADLFYIAFVCFDVMGLREQLLTLFITDIVRRLVAESLIPWLKKRYISSTLKGKGIQQNSPQQLRYSTIVEVNKQHYEPFDDYLQIVTNFGYLVMISSCFPLAPFLIYIAHGVQIVQDKYKSLHIFKRKLPQKYVGMGYWKTIIVFLCYFSIITNIMLFAFSSQQIVNFLPSLYEGGKDILYGNKDITEVVTGAGGILFSILANQAIPGPLDLKNQTTWGFNFDVPFFGGDNKDRRPSEVQEQQQKPDFTDIAFPLNEQNQKAQSKQQEDFMKNDGWGDFWQKKASQQQDANPSQIEKTTKKINNVFANLFDDKDKQKTEVVHQESLVLGQYKAPTKENQGAFIIVLFFIEHFFLFAFLTIRYFLMKIPSHAEIFLQRREYKRRIKKHLPRDVMTTIMASQVVVDIFSSIKKNDSIEKLNKAVGLGVWNKIVSNNDTGTDFQITGNQKKMRQTQSTQNRTTVDSNFLKQEKQD